MQLILFIRKDIASKHHDYKQNSYEPVLSYGVYLWKTSAPTAEWYLRERDGLTSKEIPIAVSPEVSNSAAKNIERRS